MLVKFRFSNFRSIMDDVDFTMLAGSGVKQGFARVKNDNILHSSVIYGANSSGKSNFLRAVLHMKSMVLNSSKVLQSTDQLPHEPFLLSSETDNASSEFEASFYIDDAKYRYGFEADKERVYSEWLYVDESGRREARLFSRSPEEGLYIGDKFKEGKGVVPQDNGLLLWKCDQNNGEISRKILAWFKGITIINAASPVNYYGYSIDKLSDPEFSKKITDLLEQADLNIKGLRIEDTSVPFADLEKLGLPEEMKERITSNSAKFAKVGLKSIHNRYDVSGNIDGRFEFGFLKAESEGTKKFFSIAAPMIDSIVNNKILLVDELDASMHPYLVNAFLNLFHKISAGNSRAQLIFTTHDTHILNSKGFHKSQIWFAEKNARESTSLIALSEYNGIRDSDNIERNYLLGKYSGLPNIGELSIGGDD